MDKIISANVDKELFDNLEKTAIDEDIPKSSIIRHGLRKELRLLKQKRGMSDALD